VLPQGLIEDRGEGGVWKLLVGANPMNGWQGASHDPKVPSTFQLFACPLERAPLASPSSHPRPCRPLLPERKHGPAPVELQRHRGLRRRRLPLQALGHSICTRGM
jgi:hypothetical protein